MNNYIELVDTKVLMHLSERIFGTIENANNICDVSRLESQLAEIEAELARRESIYN